MANPAEDVTKEISDIARAAIEKIMSLPIPMNQKMEGVLVVCATVVSGMAIGALIGGVAHAAAKPGAGGPRLGVWDQFAKDVLQKKVGGPIEHAANRQFLPFRGI